MQAYRSTFSNGNAAVVLSPDNEFLREFDGNRGR
jgi:membrane protease subunit HflC